MVLGVGFWVLWEVILEIVVVAQLSHKKGGLIKGLQL